MLLAAPFSLLDIELQIRRMPSGEEQEILSVGLACSECFSGPRLAKLLQPGFDYERKVMEELMTGDFASPLSNHTSGGVTEALSNFVEALEPHLPGRTARSWIGASRFNSKERQLFGLPLTWSFKRPLSRQALRSAKW